MFGNLLRMTSEINFRINYVHGKNFTMMYKFHTFVRQLE